jgi:hypothetical protein
MGAPRTDAFGFEPAPDGAGRDGRKSGVGTHAQLESLP